MVLIFGQSQLALRFYLVADLACVFRCSCVTQLFPAIFSRQTFVSRFFPMHSYGKLAALKDFWQEAAVNLATDHALHRQREKAKSRVLISSSLLFFLCACTDAGNGLLQACCRAYFQKCKIQVARSRSENGYNKVKGTNLNERFDELDYSLAPRIRQRKIPSQDTCVHYQQWCRKYHEEGEGKH